MRWIKHLATDTCVRAYACYLDNASKSLGVEDSLRVHDASLQWFVQTQDLSTPYAGAMKGQLACKAIPGIMYIDLSTIQKQPEGRVGDDSSNDPWDIQQERDI